MICTILLFFAAIMCSSAFNKLPTSCSIMRIAGSTAKGVKMSIFEDAFRFFSNMSKEASAKHILIKGPGASDKLQRIKIELDGAEDVSVAFSEVASKVNIFSLQYRRLNNLVYRGMCKTISFFLCLGE